VRCVIDRVGVDARPSGRLRCKDLLDGLTHLASARPDPSGASSPR
jgi:hypothetical protein